MSGLGLGAGLAAGAAPKKPATVPVKNARAIHAKLITLEGKTPQINETKKWILEQLTERAATVTDLFVDVTEQAYTVKITEDAKRPADVKNLAARKLAVQHLLREQYIDTLEFERTDGITNVKTAMVRFFVREPREDDDTKARGASEGGTIETLSDNRFEYLTDQVSDELLKALKASTTHTEAKLYEDDFKLNIKERQDKAGTKVQELYGHPSYWSRVLARINEREARHLVVTDDTVKHVVTIRWIA